MFKPAPYLCALALLGVVAGICTARDDAAPSRPRFVLNPQGGVVSCDLRRNPYATRAMAAYCQGRTVPSADPVRFDCASAEVASEFDFCGLPYPTRR